MADIPLVLTVGFLTPYTYGYSRYGGYGSIVPGGIDGYIIDILQTTSNNDYNYISFAEATGHTSISIEVLGEVYVLEAANQMNFSLLDAVLSAAIVAANGNTIDILFLEPVIPADLKLGSSSITTLKLGSANVDKVMLGSFQVWSNT